MINLFEIKYILGDITKLEVDVIVNSANKELIRGSGVCGAIHKEAGIQLEKECLEIKNEKYPKGLPVGEAIITKAYNLPSKYVIHTVGPRKGKDDINLLKNCYSNSLKLADSLGLKSTAFPSISTGIYGVSHKEAKPLILEALKENQNLKNLEIINFIFLEEEVMNYYKN